MSIHTIVMFIIYVIKIAKIYWIHLLCKLNYTRVYDINNIKDITFYYYIGKMLCCVNDTFTYKCVGVYKYKKNKCAKFICNNIKLSQIDTHDTNKLSGKKFYNISSIILLIDGKKINITKAKKYMLIDMQTINWTDVVKFHIAKTNIRINKSRDLKVTVTRKWFDNDTLTFITKNEKHTIQI